MCDVGVVFLKIQPTPWKRVAGPGFECVEVFFLGAVIKLCCAGIIGYLRDIFSLQNIRWSEGFHCLFECWVASRVSEFGTLPHRWLKPTGFWTFLRFFPNIFLPRCVKRSGMPGTCTRWSCRRMTSVMKAPVSQGIPRIVASLLKGNQWLITP